MSPLPTLRYLVIPAAAIDHVRGRALVRRGIILGEPMVEGAGAGLQRAAFVHPFVDDDVAGAAGITAMLARAGGGGPNAGLFDALPSDWRPASVP